jgi:hypothetical protein
MYSIAIPLTLLLTFINVVATCFNGICIIALPVQESALSKKLMPVCVLLFSMFVITIKKRGQVRNIPTSQMIVRMENPQLAGNDFSLRSALSR